VDSAFRLKRSARAKKLIGYWQYWAPLPFEDQFVAIDMFKGEINQNVVSHLPAR